MKRLLTVLFAVFLLLPIGVSAQETREVRARVTGVTVDEVVNGQRHLVFFAVDHDGEMYKVDSNEGLVGEVRFKIEEGDRVILQHVTHENEETSVFLVDVVRTPALFWIALLFAVVVVIVGRARGLASLVGLLLTLMVLFGFVMPLILRGVDPVLVTVVGSAIILAVNLPLSHGFGRPTWYAYGSTLIGLGLAWAFSTLFTSFASLSGLASEEAALLFLSTETIAVPSGLLLAGMILGAVGVLDDIAVTQIETVSELIASNPDLSRKELFRRGMNVGRHHIASVVNTLVLTYAGVALPIFLLFLLRDDIGFLRFINEEVVAEELVRTLAGTMALVLLVPVSTWLATRLKRNH